MFTISADGHLNFVRTSGQQTEEIPAGVYNVFYNARRSAFELSPINEFQNKTTLYGRTDEIANRIISTFFKRQQSTGILLSGEKGSGKSLLIKVIAQKLLESKISTLIVNDPEIPPDELSYFLSQMQQKAFIVFDEFDKNYRRIEQQEKFLSILDGVNSPQQKLFSIVVNNERDLSEFLINRPGRLFYYHRFDGIDLDVIRQYCEKELIHQEHTQSVLDLFSFYQNINFDMLKALVEEMNRYAETASKAVELLNIRNDTGKIKNYTVKVQDPTGTLIKPENQNISYRPFYHDHGFRIYFKKGNKSPDHIIEVHDNNLVEYDRVNKIYVYRVNGYRIELKETVYYDDVDDFGLVNF